MRVIDEAGNRYGKWVVLRQVEHPRGYQAQWLCRCDCGTERVVQGGSLRRGDSQSCGCLQRDRIIKKMVGQKFGRLTIIKRAGSDKWGASIWLCECECGSKITVATTNLRAGGTSSCGCLNKERVREAHILPPGVAAFNALICRMKQGAKKRGYIWDLINDQVKCLTSQPCYYCGTVPAQQGSNQNQYNGIYIYNGLDRIDNAEGYTIDNVVPCCGTCNKAKSTMTTKEFKAWIRRIYEHFAKL